MDKAPSPRHVVANRIAAFISENRLANPFGGDVILVRSEGRPHYMVAFSRPATLDGLVRVYSPNFILVSASGKLATGGDESNVFESEAHALEYMRAKWVEFNHEKAEAVPRRPPRS